MDYGASWWAEGQKLTLDPASGCKPQTLRKILIGSARMIGQRCRRKKTRLVNKPRKKRDH